MNLRELIDFYSPWNQGLKPKTLQCGALSFYNIWTFEAIQNFSYLGYLDIQFDEKKGRVYLPQT